MTGYTRGADVPQGAFARQETGIDFAQSDGQLVEIQRLIDGSGRGKWAAWPAPPSKTLIFQATLLEVRTKIVVRLP